MLNLDIGPISLRKNTTASHRRIFRYRIFLFFFSAQSEFFRSDHGNTGQIFRRAREKRTEHSSVPSPDVVAHVEQKTCFCFVGRLRFLYGFFQFCCVNLVFIAAHLELQKTNRGKQGKDESECKGNKNLQRTEPAVFRYNFKMPGVVRHGAKSIGEIVINTPAPAATSRSSGVVIFIFS